MRFVRVLALALGACAAPSMAVDVREPELPAAFDGTGSGPSVATMDWRAFFADDQLAALIGQALTANRDLQIALQRIEVARAGIRRASGALLPEISIAGGGGVTRFGAFTMDGAGNAGTEIVSGRLIPNPLGDLSVLLQASWELDVWKKLRNLRGAARASYLASIEGMNLVVTNLIADVAAAYFELLALDQTADVLGQTIVRQAQQLEMMRVQKEAGRTNELAVQQFQGQVIVTKTLHAANLQQIREAENRLNVLLGRFPQSIVRDKQRLARDVPATLSAGVPSDLLRNRPDIREAELQIRASRFDLAAARAAFYPTITISANLGYQAFDPRFLVRTPDSIAYSLVGGIVAPLVNRRAIEAEFRTAKATQIQAMFSYQAIVLASFAEVSSALFALARTSEIVVLRGQRKQVVAGTIEAADALFRAGKASYLDVLLAQQNTLDAELEHVEAMRDRHLAAIRVYKAVGGGWRGVLRTSS